MSDNAIIVAVFTSRYSSSRVGLSAFAVACPASASTSTRASAQCPAPCQPCHAAMQTSDSERRDGGPTAIIGCPSSGSPQGTSALEVCDAVSWSTGGTRTAGNACPKATFAQPCVGIGPCSANQKGRLTTREQPLIHPVDLGRNQSAGY